MAKPKIPLAVLDQIVRQQEEIDRLTAELKKLEGYRKVHESELGVCEQHCEVVQELRDLLEKYGHHLTAPRCSWFDGKGLCDCGFEQALKGGDKLFISMAAYNEEERQAMNPKLATKSEPTEFTRLARVYLCLVHNTARQYGWDGCTQRLEDACDIIDGLREALHQISKLPYEGSRNKTYRGIAQQALKGETDE